MSDDGGPKLMGTIGFLLATSTIAVALRTYTQAGMMKRFYTEDYLAVVAWVLFVFFTVCGAIATKNGLGKHVDQVDPNTRADAIFWRWLCELAYETIACLEKWIVGLWLLRICPYERWHKITIWTLMVVISIMTVLFIYFTIDSTHPVSFYWNRFSPNPEEGYSKGGSFATITIYISSILNVVGDWVLPMLPASQVWKSRTIRKKDKISIFALLCLGSIASIATIVRLPFAKTVIKEDNPDYLYTFTNLGIWSTIEIGIALTASSIATLKPLFRKIREKLHMEPKPVTKVATMPSLNSYHTSTTLSTLSKSRDSSEMGDLKFDPADLPRAPGAVLKSPHRWWNALRRQPEAPDVEKTAGLSPSSGLEPHRGGVDGGALSAARPNQWSSSPHPPPSPVRSYQEETFLTGWPA